MATEHNIRQVDDLDRTSTAEVRVVLGCSVEGSDEDTVHLDLTREHADELLEVIRPYLQAGTQVAGTPLSNLRVAQRRPERHYDAIAVREWAAEKGITIKRRGRINERLIDQYLAEQAEREAAAPPAEEATDGLGAGDGTTVPPEAAEEPSAARTEVTNHEVYIRNAGTEDDLDEDDEDDDVEQEQPEPEPPVTQAPRAARSRAGKSTGTRSRTRKTTKAAVAAKSSRKATTSRTAKS